MTAANHHALIATCPKCGNQASMLDDRKNLRSAVFAAVEEACRSHECGGGVRLSYRCGLEVPISVQGSTREEVFTAVRKLVEGHRCRPS